MTVCREVCLSRRKRSTFSFGFYGVAACCARPAFAMAYRRFVCQSSAGLVAKRV
jgi:hypothetical protein